MVAVAAVGAIAGSVMSATAASAAPVTRLTYVNAETNFDSTVYKSVRVFCPAGLQLIGGSYELSGAEGAVVLDDFIPSPDNLLVGAGEIVGPGESSDGTTASWKVVATAVCSAPLSGYSIQTGSSDFTHTGPNVSQAGRAFCPPGRSVVTGGASLSNGFGQVSISLLDVGNTVVEADAHPDVDGYSGDWSVTAYAICADLPSNWRVIEKLSPSDTFLSRTETAFCPAGLVPIGVGWRTFGSVRGVVDRYFTRAKIVTGTDPGVTVTAAGPASTSSPWQLAARAVCVTGQA